MPFKTLQDVFSFTGSIAVTVIAIFLCWALYEVARLVRRLDRTVQDVRDKADKVEKSLVHMGEKLASSATYLGFIAEGGKQLLSMLRERREESPAQHKRKKTKDAEGDELSEYPS